jgi:hypothetical protein
MRVRRRRLRVTVRRRRLRRDETLRRRRLRDTGRRGSRCVRIRGATRAHRRTVAGAHGAALYWSGVRLLLARLVSLAERRRRDRIFALIRVHQVLPVHLLLILILNVGLSVGAGDAALTRTALGIRAAVARRRRHTTMHDDWRGRVILYGSKRRGTRRAGDRGRLWLRKIGVVVVVRHMHAVTGLRRRLRIVAIHQPHLRATDTSLPRYRTI